MFLANNRLLSLAHEMAVLLMSERMGVGRQMIETEHCLLPPQMMQLYKKHNSTYGQNTISWKQETYELKLVLITLT